MRGFGFPSSFGYGLAVLGNGKSWYRANVHVVKRFGNALQFFKAYLAGLGDLNQNACQRKLWMTGPRGFDPSSQINFLAGGALGR
jgi:hypothetical protein